MPNQDVNAVIRGQEYFRLKRVVQSPGDIYELDESTKAIYIGPDSDIAEIRTTYFNPDAPGALETAVVSINGPFVGRLDTLLKTTVPSTSQPARILINPVDIVDNAYVSPTSIALRRFNVPAQIDVIAALKDLPDIPSVRADKTFRFPSVPYQTGHTFPPDDGSTDLLIPIYGRRMITATVITNRDVELLFSLVTLEPGLNPVPRALGSITVVSSIPLMSFTKAVVIRASDAARVGTVTDAVGVITNFYGENDGPPTDLGLTGTTMSPRGVADLLLINIRDTSGIPGDTTRFVDLFIKISDRET